MSFSRNKLRNTCGLDAPTAVCQRTRSWTFHLAKFVHRNVANIVGVSDINLLAVMQYAVNALKVRNIIVTGHYSCGGVRAALDPSGTHDIGLVDNWLDNIRSTRRTYAAELEQLSVEEKWDRMCELNALQQAKNVCYTSVVREAWKRGQDLSVHSWVYSLKDGRLKDLGFVGTSAATVEEDYDAAVRAALAHEKQ
eukprot:NODE_3434_length_895_cov_70.942708_g3412_i0.p1 GENE.NODE_3434_length_895_cov_70.942708_g3412_i0~~NODE_3434_length_895_cov_70.942708_g3412_i0.p1  ORF type:complete len:195 (-),score=42.59 NODE_3434_length_895_cov_70.942708_g3412_i0:72-656(-)